MEYREIVNHYKHGILNGSPAVGERLPSAREIKDLHDTSLTTATRALRTLCMEGFAIARGTTGTFAAVPGGGIVLRVPIVGTRLSGVHTPGGQVDVLSAALVQAPPHAALAMELEAGGLAIRRESTITRDGQVLRLSVGWLPGAFAEELPELLSLAHIWAGDRIREKTGRKATVEVDRYYARTAEEHEAGVMGIPVGSALLVRETRWHDDDGVIEFGEAVYPPGVSVGCEYLEGDPSRT